MNWLNWLFQSDGYMPHGYCSLWQPSILWLNVGSDGVIAISSFVMPRVLSLKTPVQLSREVAVRTAELEDTAVRLEAEIAARNASAQALSASEERLRMQDQRKDEFIATLAHELRNPLAPLQSGIALLNQLPAGADKTKQIREMMRRQVLLMVRLIDDLMDVSRITSGRLKVDTAPVSLASVVAMATETVAPSVRTAQHTLTMQQSDDDVIVLGDGARLGIAPQQIGKVFDMFTRLEADRGPPDSGLGIGLSLARRIVELHGGTLTAYSAGIGLGSDFTITLPLDATAHANHASAPGAKRTALATDDSFQQPMLDGRRVLIVDDNADAGESLAALLGAYGATVLCATNGEDALRIGSDLRPHIVFMDIGMPGLSGWETAKVCGQWPGAGRRASSRSVAGRRRPITSARKWPALTTTTPSPSIRRWQSALRTKSRRATEARHATEVFRRREEGRTAPGGAARRQAADTRSRVAPHQVPSRRYSSAMLTTFAHSHFSPFVALLCTAAVMAAACAALEDDATLSWWYEQARATRRFFVIAGLLGVASLAQGVDESVAWLLAVGMAYSVDLAHELRQLRANR